LVDDTISLVVSWSWSWNFFFGVTGEDGGWELLGIVDREAAAWDSRAGAPDASGISVALTFL
jgi:hypothetical protein